MSGTVEALDGAQASRATSVAYWTLYSWDRSGLLKPSKRVGEGNATRRLYSFTDLLAVRVLKRLRSQGAPTRRIRKALRTLRATKSDLTSSLGAKLIAVDDDVKVILDEETLVSLVRAPMQHESRVILVLDLHAEAEALRKRIDEVRAMPRRTGNPASGRVRKTAAA